MKSKKYIVLWHEDNDSGVPKHCMGMSELFDTREDAEKWMDGTIQEDSARSIESYHEPLEVCEDAGDGVWSTYGCGQHTYYHIEEVEWKDSAADAIEALKPILNGTTVKFDGPSDADARCIRALAYIREHEKDWLPLREWAVDIKFCPAACVHHVKARSGEEAQRIVDDMIDNHTLALSEEQKAEMMDCMLENVECTELVGPEDD